MKRVYIIVEGQTEGVFIKEVLRPYFNRNNIYDLHPIIIHTSEKTKGGFVKYNHLKKDVLRLLKKQDDIVVTTFVDYFRIPNDMPEYDLSVHKNVRVDEKIKCLQESLKKDINDYRFIPYIQKHEFEALLFSSNSGFEKFYDKNIYDETKKIIEKFNSPEDINDGPDSAPSKRLLNIIEGYQKVLMGNLIAIEVGIEEMLNKCPRFKEWINNLVVAAKNN